MPVAESKIGLFREAFCSKGITKSKKPGPPFGLPSAVSSGRTELRVEDWTRIFTFEPLGFNSEVTIQSDIWHSMSTIVGLTMSNTTYSAAILRQKIDLDVFDYQVLLDVLAGYGKPRDKITRLLMSGEIVRVKKGLYCFGEAFRRSPICREYLANLIYGPSYVSLDYALRLHGLIPERVEAVTSVTTRRSRGFERFCCMLRGM